MKKKHSKYCLITNDVETTSLWNHRLSAKTGEVVFKEGMPLLLDAYAKHGVKATFYFVADIVQAHPEIVRMVLPYGHEVACHGLTHDPNQAFDVLSLNQQIDHLQRAKATLEDIANQPVISFRAPALRVNKYTPIALAKTGFQIDSSVSPQRMDVFFSFGSSKKLKWLAAPRTPYYTQPDDLTRKGNGNILEIPVSSFLLPYAGTIMRIAPGITKLVRAALNAEINQTGRPLVFLIHPNELIDEEIEKTKINRRAKSYLSYLLHDKLRYHVKLKNLGAKAFPLLLDQLSYIDKNKYRYVTSAEYLQIFKRNKEK